MKVSSAVRLIGRKSIFARASMASSGEIGPCKLLVTHSKDETGPCEWVRNFT